MLLQDALFLRPIRRRPLRFLVTVLGVAAGVAAVVATLASSRAAIASLEQGVLELSGRARLEVRASGGLADSVLGDLRPCARREQTNSWWNNTLRCARATHRAAFFAARCHDTEQSQQGTGA